MVDRTYESFRLETEREQITKTHTLPLSLPFQKSLSNSFLCIITRMHSPNGALILPSQDGLGAQYYINLGYIQTISHAKARPQGLEQRSVMLQTVGSVFYIYIYIWTNPSISTFYRPDLISFTIQLFDLSRIFPASILGRSPFSSHLSRTKKIYANVKTLLSIFSWRLFP